ncbi:hypothetical protein [Acidovorax sp. sic0104]|uniref:hypothetical protein n=1 Tax=Acidovorax sp. sic0104 TaxID=2854784 RepID=UPI001C4835E8|nr:hypothetical protein [Acidovorax sp. sic0104]MBV7542227.1 hypothetical protein [Acidovorax sp. sic0104]
MFGIAFLVLLAMRDQDAAIGCGIAACGLYALAAGLMFRYGMPGAGRNSLVHLVLMVAVMAAAT